MIDVCLLLEGTYPYVAGGVSTWVHQLVSHMRDIRFGIVYISPHADPTRTFKYHLPDNIIYIKEVDLHDYRLEDEKIRKPQKHDFDTIELFYRGILKNNFDIWDDFLRLFQGQNKCFTIPSFFKSKGVWDLLHKLYYELKIDVSFIDFFWTWRGTHLPLLQILTTEVPQSKIYHAVSTGYAGLLGAVAKSMSGGKYYLTEHGIYTHERILEITQANWIYDEESDLVRATSRISFFKEWWITLFKILSRMSYFASDKIFTLYEGNRLKQIFEGAAPEKVMVIPNGIRMTDYMKILPTPSTHPRIGLIGRVVGIKDIKTFIEAAKIVLASKPDAEFFIVGPLEEEEDYVNECKSLVDILGLNNKIQFTGRMNMADILGKLDLVVLTSVSEAQPYVVLEANAVGIPVVSTNVGACAEMLYGVYPEDVALGPSGVVTGVANPAQTAKAMVDLLAEPETYKKMGEAGKQRVARYYDQDDLLSRYLNVYETELR
ncbi:GT4 family glycosyltransferase PelF [bacterium]|nr:GT4 family glycosyltransferase PelF [bacterium]